MTLETTVRDARLDDAGAIARIYSEGIEDRVATFETEPRSRTDVEQLLSERQPRYPALVAERDGRVIAFAWTMPYSSRPAYAGVAEFSVYVARQARGMGAGTEVLNALCAAAEAAGFWKLTSRVFPENVASRTACRKAGFAEIGVHRRHGRLDGKWRDCVVVEKLLGPALDPD